MNRRPPVHVSHQKKTSRDGFLSPELIINYTPLVVTHHRITMSSTVWEEVKKLAADFQRTQASSSLQRLSERNCVDVVKKLIALNLLDVIFTCDGKEYVTPEYLLREMEDELVMNSGRIHLADLACTLNIDFAHIEAKAAELARNSAGEVVIVLGQLINSEYREKLAEEINVKLRENGVVNVADLSKHYDLPAHFIDSLIGERLGLSIHGVRDAADSRTIFTDSYVNQYKAKLRGILLATTRPVSLPQILSRFHLPEKISYSCVDTLIRDGDVKGSIHSGTKVFTPEIFNQRQKEYADSFYQQNSYLEYSTLSKIGITDPKSFCTNRFPDSIPLKTCCVSQNYLYQLDSTIEECINSASFAEVSPVVPSVLSQADIETLIDRCVSGNKSLEAARLMTGNGFVSDALIDSLQAKLAESFDKKAAEDLKSGKLFDHFAARQQARDAILASEESSKMSRKEERKKKAAAKSNTGGGTQGREVKIKNTKRKYKPGQKGRTADDDSDGDVDTSERSDAQSKGKSKQQLEFMTRDELIDSVRTAYPELEEMCPELPAHISDVIYEPLNSKYMNVARQVFAENTASAASSKKKSHTDLQQSLSSLYSSIHLYLKGLESVQNDQLREQLLKFLQKTTCCDAVNSILSYMSPEENPNLSNTDARVKTIGKLDSDVKEGMLELNNILNSSSLDGFLQKLEVIAQTVEVILKPVDKKREKILLTELKHNLIFQLNETEDSGLALHLSVLLLFQLVNGVALHASGKFVPQILQELKDGIDEKLFKLLSHLEELVISQVRASRSETPDVKEVAEIGSQLQQLLPQVKEAVVNFKIA